MCRCAIDDGNDHSENSSGELGTGCILLFVVVKASTHVLALYGTGELQTDDKEASEKAKHLVMPR